MTWILLITIPATAAFVSAASRRHGIFTAGILFSVMNCIAAVSITPLLNPTLPSDRLHGYILLYTGIAVPLTAFIAETSTSLGQLSWRPARPPTYVPRNGIYALLALSAVIIVAYFLAVGYSALFEGIKNATSGGTADVAGLRLDSYAGKRYLFPGYVNQFKNVIYPALTVLVITYWHREHRSIPLVPATGLIMMALFSLLGTGQRGAFVLFVAVTIVFIYTVRGNLSLARLMAIALGGIVFLAASTFALGRTSTALDEASGPLDKGGVLLGSIIDRIFSQGGQGKVVGFEYIYNINATQNGQEWLQSFQGVLPGNRGSSLANEIFAYQWGSLRGNSPPSIWADIYFNFGMAGIALAPVALAVVFGCVARLRVKSAGGNTMEIIGISGVAVVLGFWTSGSPVVLLNNGIVPYALMWWIGYRHRLANPPERVRSAALTDVSSPGTRIV